MTEGIKQTEKGAFDFSKNVYGIALADAMFLTRPSFVISDSEGEYHFLSSEKFALDLDEDLKDFKRR